MKKILAAATAALMLVSAAAMAETTADNNEVTVESIVVTEADAATENTTGMSNDIPAGSVINITVSGPDGYAVINHDGDQDTLYVEFAPTGDETTTYNLGVAYSEVFDGYTLENPTEDQVAQMTATLTEDYNNATLEVRQADNGMYIIVVNENGADSDYVDLITVQNGYFIQVSIFDETSQITDSEIQSGIGIITSLGFNVDETAAQ